MCSIGGAVFKEGLTPDEALRLANALLFFGRDRGDQSAGLWIEGMGGPPFKRATDVASLINSTAYKNLFNNVQPQKRFVLLTHTRLPTCGGRTDADAQPFKAGDTVTIHNGMISNPSQLDRQFKLKRRTLVDSEVFTRYINRYGMRNLPKFLKAMSGSMAVVAYKAGRLYAFRDGNPMWVATIKDEGLIWASTKEMLHNAMVAIYGYIPEHHMAELKEDTIYAFRDRGVVERLATFRTRPYSYSWTCDDEFDIRVYGNAPYERTDPNKYTPVVSGAAHKIVRMGSSDPDTPWSVWAKEGIGDDVVSTETTVEGIEETGTDT